MTDLHLPTIPAFTRTRLAPTPSGFLHPGNVLSFLLTAALAEKHGASVLLRIDDLDRERADDVYVQDIFDTLRFLEIRWDEGPQSLNEYHALYSQLHRLTLYDAALNRLRLGGHLFACTCSRAQILRASADGSYPGTCRNRRISLDHPGVNWRLLTPDDLTVELRKGDGTLIRSGLPAQMRDFVVRKKDGLPAYQLSSVVDDEYFRVDMVVRGQDLWPSTLAQLYLGTLLDSPFTAARFVHHRLLLDRDGNKLSKSAGSRSVRHFRKEGRTPADLLSELSRLLGRDLPVTNATEFMTRFEGLLMEEAIL